MSKDAITSNTAVVSLPDAKVTTHINVNLFYTYFRYKYKMKNSQYQMLHISIIPNNFLNNKSKHAMCAKIRF